MDPFTIGMMAATALSTGLQVFGQVSGGDAKLQEGIAKSRADMAEGDMTLLQASLYGLNAETAKANVGLLTTQAEIAGLGEDFAYAKARLQKGRISEQGRVTMATQRATFASRNVDPTFGSPLLTQALTAGRVAQDLDLTDAGAAVEAADARTRKANIYGQAAGAQGQVVSAVGNQLSSQKRATSLFTRAMDDIDAGRRGQSASEIGAASALLSGVTKMGGSGFSMPSLDLSGIGFNPIAGVAG